MTVRADNLGSFLRPQSLLDAAAGANGDLRALLPPEATSPW
jgi:hypothetical protein